MRNNFERPRAEEEVTKKESLVLERDWEDENLPESFEVVVYETTLKDITDEVAIFEDFNQGIGTEKIPGRVQRGDKFKIYMADSLDQGVPTNGIVKIKNVSTGEVSNTETWRD